MPFRKAARHISCALLCLCLGKAAHGQLNQPAPLARFDVATIKPAKTDEPTGIRVSPTRFSTINASLADLLKYAYSVHASQIIGGPDDLMHRRYDIDATTGTATMPSSDAFKQMVRHLLADRFHLTLHPGTRDLSVYLLTISNPAIHLTPTKHADYRVPNVGRSPGWLSVQNATTNDFAAFLQRFVTDRPVLDQTGIPGKFDIELHWTPEDGPPPTASTPAQEYPELFAAIREQLGLKLQPVKAPDDVLIIDTATAPTAD